MVKNLSLSQVDLANREGHMEGEHGVSNIMRWEFTDMHVKSLSNPVKE